MRTCVTLALSQEPFEIGSCNLVYRIRLSMKIKRTHTFYCPADLSLRTAKGIRPHFFSFQIVSLEPLELRSLY